MKRGRDFRVLPFSICLNHRSEPVCLKPCPMHPSDYFYALLCKVNSLMYGNIGAVLFSVLFLASGSIPRADSFIAGQWLSRMLIIRPPALLYCRLRM